MLANLKPPCYRYVDNCTDQHADSDEYYPALHKLIIYSCTALGDQGLIVPFSVFLVPHHIRYILRIAQWGSHILCIACVLAVSSFEALLEN